MQTAHAQPIRGSSHPHTQAHAPTLHSKPDADVCLFKHEYMLLVTKETRKASQIFNTVVNCELHW